MKMFPKVLLFINGEPPKKLPNAEDFDLVVCTDGAFHYLKEKGFPLEKLDFITGDFDSYLIENQEFNKGKFIYTPDQNFTDFHKVLEIIAQKGGKEISVYGASGREQDHFLGNLNTAYLFRNQLNIKFFDEYSSYFFINNEFELSGVQGKMISLMPFPMAKGVFTRGLHWELRGEILSLTEKISTRNRADMDNISINYESGALLLFVEN